MRRLQIMNTSLVAVAPELVSLCGSIRVLVTEMHAVTAGEAEPEGRCRRRALCHVRQIAMYVCHVVLRIPMIHIGLAFGRDPSTVSHACRVIEDRREDRAYDEFVSSIERVVEAVFSTRGRAADGWN